ncbi:MAG: hypothetical protein CME81_05295 [Halomonas sp.]|nr:hypothetical protein [Halomonas sp.]
MTFKKSRWFVEVFLDGSTVRFWNGFEAITFDGETFDPLGDRFSPPDRVRLRSSLDSDTIKLSFDSSRQTDNSDTLGALLDSNIRRRQIRLRNVHYNASPDDGDVISDTYGRIRSTPDTISPGGEPQLDVEIESGSLVYLERRMQTRSPVNQKEAFPDDKGFDLAKVLEGKVLAWRTKTVKSGTVEVSAAETDDFFARKLAIGEFATEGTFVAHFTGKQQLKHWFRVFAIADCRIEQLNKVWINGNLQVNTALAHGVRTLVRLPNDKGENRCWITFYDGRHNQNADSELVTYASEWTSNHRLRGVAYVVIEHQWDDDLPEAFDYKFAGKGARFYDRRKDSTAGGSGSHRLTDPSTWEYTTNRMVVTDHYRQGIRIMPPSFTAGGADPSVYWFGVGESADAIPYDEFKDLADLCDESVPLKAGGSQKRYEVHGILSADDDHKKNLEKLASGMAARAVDQGGRIVFRPIRSQSVVMTLTDGDLSSTEDSVYDPTGRIDDMVNAVEGRFVDPDQDFASTDYPRVVNDTYVAEDGGDLIVGTENADMDISGERAQRVATLKLNFSRRVATLEEVFLSSKVRGLKASDWFSRESSLRGIPSGKTFEVDEIERRKDGTTKILAFEVDPDVDAWEASNAVDLSVPPYIPPSQIIDLTTPSITITPFSYTGGGAEVPAVRLDNADYDDFIGDEIVGEFGLHDGAGGITGESATVTFPGNIQTLEGLIGLPPSTTFAIRFQSRKGERVSAWSSFQTFTTTSVYRSGTSGIADSFVGQNWGATASENEASNDYAPFGENRLYHTRFYKLAGFWSGSGASGTPGEVTANTSAGLRYIRYQQLGMTAGTYCFAGASPQRPLLACVPGQVVHASFVASASNCNSLSTYISFHDSAGNTISQVIGDEITSGLSYPLANRLKRPSVTAVAPAGTAFVRCDARARSAAAGTVSVYLAEPVLMFLPTLNSTPPPFQEGRDYDDGSDVTGENTAPAIYGQGALATRNDVGTAQIAAGAITNIDGNSDDGDTTLAAHAWTTVASETITTSGGKVLIIVNAVPIVTTAGLTYPRCDARIMRGGTVIRPAHTTAFPVYDGASGMLAGGAYCAIELDEPGAGTFTYSLQLMATNGAGSGTLETRKANSKSITVAELKR